jgi:shikimate kinase
MGSGKSKTAESLSKLLKLKWLDTDKLIEERSGKSITEYFHEHGPESFRILEREVLHSTAGIKDVVVSTGGGAPCYFDNMEWMNKMGITVYLEANPGLLFHRLATSKGERPLIQNLSDVELMEQIASHLVERTPFYSKAKITVKAADMNVKSLSDQIKKIQVST